MRLRRLLATAAASLSLHLMVPMTVLALQGVVWLDLELEDDDPAEAEEGGDGGAVTVAQALPPDPLDDLASPMKITVLFETEPVPDAAAPPTPPLPPTNNPVVPPLPVPTPQPPEEPPKVEPPQEPPQEETPTVADTTPSQGDGNNSGAGQGDGEGQGDGDAEDGEGDEEGGIKGGKKGGRGGNGGKKNPSQKPCPPPTPAIVRTGMHAFTVDRAILEFYASHLLELNKLGIAATYKDKATGQPDGFKIKLARCSVLKQAGLRSYDVIRDINGRKVTTVTQAVQTYFALRKEKVLTLNVLRKDKKFPVVYTIIKDDEHIDDRSYLFPEAPSEKK